MTPATSSSGLVTNPIPQQPCNRPILDDWDRLLQPMFDEYFNPLTIAVSLVLVVAAPRAVDLADSHVSTSIDQDDPSIMEKNKLDEDIQGTPVDATLYHGMIGSLMYLTSSRPDLIYADTDMSLTAYVDADHTGCQDTRRSTSRSAQVLGDKHLTDYGFQFNKIPLYCDNKSAIALCCNNVQHSRAKHIDVRYHFIKEQVENEIVELYGN
ncbi:retrovirus-related pol polyprotein from transposon TNT 1-94 [Tanacetum coccineum]